MFDRKLRFARNLHFIVALTSTLILCLFTSATAAAQVTLSTTTLSFGTVVLNQQSSIQTVSIKNNQSTTQQNLTFTLPALTLYALAPSSTTCVSGSALTAGASCTVGLTFNPKSGSISSTSSLTVNTTGGTAQKVALSGTALSQVTLSTNVENYGNVALDKTSAIQTVTVTNNQSVSLTLTSLSVTASSEYAIDSSSTCHNSIVLSTGGGSCTVALTFTPTSLGVQPTGTLSILSNASSPIPTVSLVGAGVPQVSVAPTSLSFAAQSIGTTSAAQSVTATNNQLTALSISSVTITGANSGDFAVANSCPIVPATLAGGLPCNVSVTFKPTASGTRTAILNIVDSANNSPQSVTLSGTGFVPTSLSVGSLAFGNVPINTTSASQVVTLNNNVAGLSISSITASSGFSVVTGGTCSTSGTMSAGASCTIDVAFAPTSTGAQSGTLTIVTNASNSPQSVTLSGTGIVPTSLSVGSLAFGNVPINTTSASQVVTLNNNVAGLSISSITASSGFSVVTGGTCSTSGTMSAGASCTIDVAFAPTSTGAQSGTLTIVTNASNSPQSVTLSGTGIVPTSLSVGSLAFGNLPINTTSASQVVTLNNNVAGLSISSITASSGFSVVTGGTCSTSGTMSAGASCTIDVAFAPTVTGAQSGTLTIVTNASNSPQSVTLSGTGTSAGIVTLSPTSLAFGTVEITNTVVKNVTLTNNQSVPLNIASVTGFPAAFSLNYAATTCVAGTPVASGGSCIIAVSVTPTAAGVLSGTVTVNDDATPATQTFTVSATASAKLVPSPLSLSFVSQTIGTTSSSQTITLTNPQSVGEAISGATITGINASDFSVTTSCPLSPATLPAGGSCPLTVTFTPSAPGARSATLSIGDPLFIPLSGSGAAPVTVLPGLLTYTAPVGTTSTLQTVTITNASTTNAIHITQLDLSGDFIQTASNCPINPVSLAAGASCTLTISFDPTIGGVRDGQLQVYENDVATSPQVINITGTGTYPLTLSGPTGPPSLSFSAQTVGTSSTPKTLTLTNHEAESETFTLGTTGDFSAISNCATGVIAAKSSCLVYVVFNPSSVLPSTTRNGTLTVADSAPGGPAPTASLTGSAIATNLPAAVSVVSPGAGSAGTTINAVITGNGQTHFNASSVITFTQTDNSGTACGIAATVPNTATTSFNTINAQFVISGVTPVFGACDISVATVLPAGAGTETALLSMAFIIADPSNAHIIETINPNFGIQGQTLNVNLTATGTNFVNGVTYANFGDGITVNSLIVTDPSDPNPNQAQANITISNTTPVGYRTITLVTGGEFATSSSTAFQIGPNSATLTGLTLASIQGGIYTCTANPVVVPQGFSGAVCLTATGTHFLQNATLVSFTGGILSPEVTVTSPTTAIVNVAVQGNAAVGLQNASVSTGGEIATLNNSLTVTGATPALLSVSPGSGTQGQTLNVVITGNAFTTFPVGVFTHPATDPIVADFTGEITVNSITVTSASLATVNITVSPNANVGGITADLSVSNGSGGATVFPFGFAVTPSSAAITNVTPACVAQGGQVTLAVSGVNTLWVQGTTMAAFYPVPYENISVDEVTITDATDALLNVAVSTDTPAGTYGFYVATGGQVVSSTIKVCAATPSLTMSPSNGLLPTGSAVNNIPVSFTGQFTHFGPSTAAVISGEGVTVQNFVVTGLNSAQATVSIIAGTNGTPTATGLRLVTLTTGGEIVTTNFNVTSTPVGLISVSPYHAPPSTTTSVEIVGLNTHFNPNTTQVLFGPQITVNNASLNVIDATHLTVSVTTSFIDNGTQPTPPGWQNIYVNSATGTGYTTAAGLPTTTGGVGAGAVVSITASNGNLTSCTETTPGSGYQVGDYVYPTEAGGTGSACKVTAVNGTAIATLTANTEQVMGGFLIDSPAQPTLVSVCVTGSNPCVSSAQQGATVDVTITGSLTNWVQGTTEAILGAGVSVSNLVITSPTTATATIAVSPTAPVGGNSVILFTGSEIVSGSGFSVSPGASLIYSVGPDATCDANALTIADFCGVSNGAGTPFVVSQLQTITLNVVGVGTHWLQGETSFSFGVGVAIDSLTVSSPTKAQVQITVLSTSPVGFVALTATTGGEVTTLQQALDIEEGFPALLAISPGGQVQGDTLSLQVLGRFTNWQQGVTSAAFNQDITVNSVNVIDSDNLILNITVSPLAYVDFSYPCGHILTVTTGTTQVVGNEPPSGVAPSYFCVSQGAEEITNVSANTFAQGTSGTVTITGSATDFEPGVSLVSFGDSNISSGTVTVNSTTSLSVPIAVSTSATVGYHTVTVTTLGEVASQVYGFTVAPNVATLNEAIPNQAEQGAPIITSPTCSTLPNCTIRLLGQYSHFSSESTATFGAGITVQSVAFVSATEVDAQITIDPLSYTGGRVVTVTTPGVSCSYQPAVTYASLAYQGCTPGVPTGTGSEIVSNNVFTIIPGPAIISAVAPATGNEGQEVVFNITGDATHWAQNFTQFYIAGGGSDLTVNSVVINSATSATVDLSISPTANPGTRSIYMVTNGEALTDSGAFVVTGGVPVVTYLSPNSVQNSPTAGTNGLEITINGLYTQWAAGSTSVSFANPGITLVSFQVDDATHIEAVINISPSAQTGYGAVKVVTTGIASAPNGVQLLTSNFLVSAPAPPPNPYIWYESPWSGLPGQTFNVTFYGAYTHWDPGTGQACGQTNTTLTGFNASVTVNCFQVLSPTSATANITISPSATASVSDLTFTTNLAGGGTEVENSQFSVVIAQPILTVVDPGSGMQGSQNLVVNILGQNTTFDNTTTFNFGSGVSTNGSPTILGPTIATQSISIDQLATLGGRSVVATTADVSGIGHTVSGAGFTVSPSLALILSVTPNTAEQGVTGYQVEVAGQNTHWSGSTVFTFGAGIQVTKVQVNGLNDATLWLSIPALAPEGPTWVTATTFGEVANLNNGFVVQAGTPYLLSSGPNSEPQQGAAVFTILSQATQWTVNPPTVSYGAGVVVSNVHITSDTSLTVDGYIQPTTPVGYRNLTVTSGTQVLGLNNTLYIEPGPAVINDIVASSAGQGANVNVTINGTNTNWLQGVTTLTFPNVVINGTPLVVSPTQITANITVNNSAPAGEESVTATTDGEVAAGINVFTVIQTQPELLAVVASSEVQGWTGTVTLTGKYTNFTTTGCSPNCSTVNFGTGITVNSVTAASATSIQANITVQPTTTLGYRNVTVTTGSQAVSLTNAFNVTVGPAAIIEALNPFNAPQNWSGNVIVVGSQTHWLQGTTTANFGPYINVTGVTVTDTQHATVAITVQPNAPLTFYDVSLTTGGEVATGLGAFTVTTGLPSLIAINPPFAHLGDGDAPYFVEITGRYTHFTAGTSVANFGTGITVNSIVVNSPTDIQANITVNPAGTTGSRTITVTTGTEIASMVGGFTVLPGVPALTTATPNSGQAGQTVTVTINGQFTNFQQGFTSVSIGGGLPAPTIVTVNSLTQVEATLSIPANATVGTSDITVTTNGTPLTLSGGFTVTPGTPVITQINPNIGNPGQTGLTVTLSGQYTNWTTASTVTIGTPADGITVVGAAGPGLPGPVTYTSAKSVNITVNIASGAPVGPADVLIATGGSTQSIPGGFTVQAAVIPAPSIISLSPGGNAGGIPINSSFTAVFSQPMNRTTFTNSTVLLYLSSNQGSGNIPVSGAINVDATGRVLTFTPNSLLAVNSTYYLELTSGIKDATSAGNSINNYGVSLYTVFSANTTPATVVAFNPPANATNIGTNVPIGLLFSAPINQGTDTGVTVTTGGNPVAGTFLWNANVNCCGWGWAQQGNLLYFTPTTPLAANTTYTVAWGAPLADTAGNAVTPGSFTFTTGSGADTTTNNATGDIADGQTNVGTNVAPKMFYAKPISPININGSTLELYNSDSGKYINGTVTVAPDGMSATFTPAVPLLPDTYYRLYQAGGYYEADGYTVNNTGAYLNGLNTYFTTGNGTDLTAPGVASISPANVATSVPLNAQVIVKFTSPISPEAMNNIITVTPAGSSPISGTTTLASDLVTLFFVPTTVLQPGTVYTVSVSGYQDVVGNVGAAFSSTFTTASSIAPINVSTGFNASGQLITINNTADAHWSVYPLSGTPSEETFAPPASGTSQPLLTVGPGDAGWYSGWGANGPGSDWININPNSSAGNTYGLYYTTFNISGPSVPANLCLVGGMSIDDSGLLALNGTAITGNISGQYSLYPLNIPVSSNLVAGSNTLALGWGSTDNYDEAFRLQATIQTCGSVLTSGTSLTNQTSNLVVTSATPSYSAGGVATNTTIRLVFNNPLDPATVNSTTLPVMIGWNSNAEIAGTYAFSTTNASNDTVTFTPDTPFPVNTQIWVGACNGPFDLAGDTAAYNGCNTQLTYFTTASTVAAGQPANTGFQVMAFSPSNGSTNVGLRAPVTATFNRSLNFGSVNNNDYALFNGDSQSPWCDGGSYSHSQDGTSISFNCGALPSSATLTAVLGSGLQDWNGDALTPYTSQFTTTYYDSNTHGSLITQRPANGASGVNASLPIVLYYNLPLNASGANTGIEVAENNVAVPGTVQVLDGGYTLVFTPSVAWTPGALIQWWTTSSLTDTVYNANVNTTSGYFFVGGSTATLTPTVQVASPAQYTYSPGVPLNSIFDLQFNTPLNSTTVNSTNLYIFDNSNGNVHIPVTLTQPQPDEILMVPTSALPVNHLLYVFIGSGLQSTTSVPATQTQWYEYTNTTSDTTLPLVTSAVPYNGATGVGVNDQPGVIFNKSIDPVSVNSNTFQVTNGGTPLAGSYWFNSTNTRVEFVPDAPLPSSTNLTMTLNGVLDPVGNPVTFSSSFTTGITPDITAPTVLWTSVSNSESIPTNSAITIQFSESMDVTTFSTGASGDIYIYDAQFGGRVPAALTWNASQSVAYLLPSTPLAAGREYYLYVNSGTDLAGNQVSGIETTFYATFASTTTAPTVINFNPISGATGLGTNAVIEAQFSAPIDPNFITGVTLSQGGSTVQTTPVISAGNTVLQLVPSAPLSPNTVYVLTISGVKDPVGNTVATVTDTFTTGLSYDIAAATVVSVDPPNNATVGTNVVAKIVFNKPLNPITVNNSSIEMCLSDTCQWIPLTVTPSLNGLEVTLTPQNPLLPNTTYRYYVGYNSYVQDQNGNNVYGGWYYFTTSSGAVTAGPTVSVSPLNAAAGVPLNAVVIATVSAPIDPTSWSQNSIQLLNGATPAVGTVSEPNNQELIFTPTNPLTAGTTYTVHISGFTDANGNAVVASTTSFTTGGASSGGGLSYTGANINNNATITNTSQPIILNFSQILDPATVNSTTLEVMVGWNSYRGIAGTYAVNGNQVTFTPAVPYPSGAQITVGECGGPTDILGDVFQNGNCWSQELLYFNVPSYTAGAGGAPTSLTVLSVSPANGATNVRHDQPVSVTFSNPINSGTAGSYNTQLYAGQDLLTNGNVTISADGRTLTFNTGALNYNGTTYTIAIPAGGVTDEWGNSLASTYTSTFTTSVNPATGNGSVQSTNPANTSGIATDNLLTLYMNRQVDSSTATGSITVTVNGVVYGGTTQVTGGGYEIQYTPTVPFPNSATVQWFFSGNVQDVNGDLFNGDSGYFYTVAAPGNPATTAPVIVAISPRYAGSTNVPTNANVDIEYSLPIDPTTLNTSNVYINSGPATPYTVGLAPGTNNVVRITPSTPWNASNVFYGFCSNGNVKGTNGVAATNTCWLTYFYTATGPDTTPGTVKIGPPDGSANVGTNAYIRLQFSKPVDVTTINSTNVAITTGGNPIPGSWSYNYSGNDVIGANFSPVNPLPPSTPISVSVSGLLDYAGNTFPAASSNFTTAATPDYSTPTVSLDFAGGATGISTTASFNCHYSEAMDPSSVNPSNTFIYSYTANANNWATDPWTYTWSSDLTSVTMTPTSPLFANAQYYYACYSAIDLTGNGQSNANASFYTGNGPLSQGPVLLYANPPNGFTNVPVDTNQGPWVGSSLGLLFNESVAGDSLGNITLTPNGGSPIPVGAYTEYGNTIVWVQLPWALLPNTTYTYNVTGVTDYSGNAITPTTSTFTTGVGFDFTSPTVASTLPANGASGVAVTSPLSLTFSFAMDPVLINSSNVWLQTHNTHTIVSTTLSFSADFKTVTLTPTAPLAESTIYDLVIYPNSGFWPYDIAGNGLNVGGYVTYNSGYVFSEFTTAASGAVNGVCGSANGGSFPAPPTANLCSAGTVAGLSNVAGNLSWSCASQDGGTTASCSATVTPANACYGQPSSLVSWWRGDGDATDHMGNNNGTLENGVSFALGEVNNAFSFNGNNQYVLIGEPVPTDLQIQNNITLSAWIYPTAYPTTGGSNSYAFVVGSQIDGSYGGATLFYAADTQTNAPAGHIDLQIGDGSAWHNTYTESQVPLNQWTLVTATRTAGSAAAQIYFNGVAQAVASPDPVWNGTVSYPNNDWFAIGQEVNENRPFTGLIDEVQVYNTALTATQVQGLYNAGNTGVCP